MTDTRQHETATPMKEMDHTSPVDGAQRVFRREETDGQARADGGQPPQKGPDNGTDEADKTADEEDEVADEERDTADERSAAADERFREWMKEMDHTAPVEGAKRTFERDSEEGRHDVTE